MRSFARDNTETRPVIFETGYTRHADGSVLISVGDTKVLCTAFFEDKVPPFLKGKGQGWLTAEYSMLPGATHQRSPREAARGKQSGRTVEIQRLIGRSLRAALNLKALGERTIVVDCDVIQADGGTRTAAITGGWVALVLGLWRHRTVLKPGALCHGIASVSVGLRDDRVLVDLDYQEDAGVLVDMNLVQTHEGSFVEIQGTGEEGVFSPDQLTQLLASGRIAVQFLAEKQIEALINAGVDRTFIP
ncbi:MAG: ribonuclease PH [Acidobacteria bacterium]|nr:ribonuclease PH [Acidobacteriota bacterium]